MIARTESEIDVFMDSLEGLSEPEADAKMQQWRRDVRTLPLEERVMVLDSAGKVMARAKKKHDKGKAAGMMGIALVVSYLGLKLIEAGIIEKDDEFLTMVNAAAERCDVAALEGIALRLAGKEA